LLFFLLFFLDPGEFDVLLFHLLLFNSEYKITALTQGI